MSILKKQDIVAILTYISRNGISQKELHQARGNQIPNVDEIIDHLLANELISKREGILSITEKGLRHSRAFYGKKSHQRKNGGKRPTKRRGLIQIAVLQLLKEQPRHGYEVMKLLEVRSEGVYTPSAGTIYPALQDLSERGLISIEEQSDKKVYALTTSGLDFLKDNVDAVDEDFWEEWRIHLVWKQSKEAELLRKEMDTFQLEYQQAVRKVLQNPSLAVELAEIIKNSRDHLIKWSEGN